MSVPVLITVLVFSNGASLFLGWLWGTTAQAAKDRADAAAKDPEGEETSRPHRWWDKVLSPYTMVPVLIAIGAVTAVQGWTVSHRQDELVACVAGYSNGLADSLEERTGPTQEANARLDDVMDAVAAAFETADPNASNKIRDAVNEFRRVRAAAREAQLDHPYPEAPRDACSQLLD